MSIDNVLSTIKSGVAGITFASPAEALTAVYIKPDDLVGGVDVTPPFAVVHTQPTLMVAYDHGCRTRLTAGVLVYIAHDNEPFGSTIDAQIEAKAQAYASGLINWYSGGVGLNGTAYPIGSSGSGDAFDMFTVDVNVPFTWNTKPYKMVYMSIDIEVEQ